MNATQFLKADHAAVQDLCLNCREAMTTDPEVCRGLFEKIRDDLDLHCEMEERLFYPAASSVPELYSLVEECLDDHMVIKELLGEVTEALQGDAEQLGYKLSLLFDNVTRHIREEEDCLLPAVEEALGADRMEELGAQMEGMKGPAIEEATERGWGIGVQFRR